MAPAAAACALSVSVVVFVEIRCSLSCKSNGPADKLTQISGPDPNGKVSIISLGHTGLFPDSLSAASLFRVTENHRRFSDIPETKADAVDEATKDQVPLCPVG